MYPRWHIFWGAIFSAVIWISAPKTNFIYILFVLFSSILMDFDHYLCAVLKTRKLGLFHSFAYHDEMKEIMLEERNKGIREKGDFHLFHTIEFHILVGLLGFLWIGFFYVFLGMVFHSLLDIVSMLYDDLMYRREFFLVKWLWEKFMD